MNNTLIHLHNTFIFCTNVKALTIALSVALSSGITGDTRCTHGRANSRAVTTRDAVPWALCAHTHTHTHIHTAKCRNSDLCLLFVAATWSATIYTRNHVYNYDDTTVSICSHYWFSRILIPAYFASLWSELSPSMNMCQ